MNERIIIARFYSKDIKMTVVQCYAPTNDASDVDKEHFYEVLQNLVIGGSIFTHKGIHKLTWTSPNGVTNNQIDHITIDRRFRRSLKDVKVRRGADVGSDHELVISNLSCVDSRWRRAVERGMMLISFECMKLLKRSGLSNRFQVLEQTERVEDCWSGVNEAICGACEEVLGFRTHAQPRRMTGRSLKKVSERKAIKDTINATKSERLKTILKNKYIAKDKEVENSVRADKRTYMDDLAKQACCKQR